MPIKIIDKDIIIEIVLRPPCFTELVECHLRNVPNTRELEHEASHLCDTGFAEKQLAEFIRKVCEWGGYAGIAGRVLNEMNNPPSTIPRQFIKAAEVLNSDVPDIQGAWYALNHIKHLGPSFASKHLRFLRPDVCPVLDGIISQLGYAMNSNGYKQLSDDCLRIAKALQQYAISNPMNRESGRWFAADVEMALYAYWNPRWGVTRTARY